MFSIHKTFFCKGLCLSKWKHRCLSLQRGAHCRRSFHPWPVCKKLYFLIFSFFEILVSTVGSHRKNNEVSCTTANNKQRQTTANGDGRRNKRRRKWRDSAQRQQKSGNPTNAVSSRGGGGIGAMCYPGAKPPQESREKDEAQAPPIWL